MKKIFVLIIGLLICALTSCSSDSVNNNVEGPSDLILTPSSGYRYIYRTDCTSGLLHKKDGAFLWYYDYAGDVDIPLCSNPSCSHDSKSCYSFFPGWTFTCNNKIFLISVEDNWSETDGFKCYTTVTVADLYEQTRCDVLRIDYEATHSYAYGNKLFLVCKEGYYNDGESLWESPAMGRIYLIEISLDTTEITYRSECLADGYFADAELWGVFDNELYFKTYWSDNFDNDKNTDFLYQPSINKYFKYVLSNHEIIDKGDYENFMFIISNDCMITYDKGTTSFVTPEKTCKLTSEIQTDTTPIYPLFETNNAVYFTVYGNAFSIFKYDLVAEKLYEAEYAELQNNTLAAVRENGYVFVTEDEEAYTLKKEDMLFSEIDNNRYNEVCEKWKSAAENDNSVI